MDFQALLTRLSKNKVSTPYFLRCYNSLCEDYKTNGTRSSLLISLQDLLGIGVRTSKGYILGTTTVTRSRLTADIFFIHVSNGLRRHGYGMDLVKAFEEEVIKRSALVGYKIALLRITMKACLEHSIYFWQKNGFQGALSSASVLIKEITCC